MENMFSGFAIAIQPEALFFLVIASLFGMICGIIPGLSGANAVILLTPLTLTMDPNIAFLILISAAAASDVAGSITSILIGIPGAGINAATVFDGYPLAKQGRAAEAIGATASASFFGGIFGAFVLVVSLPIMRELVLLFGPPEFLLLAVWGLSVIGALAGRSILNGLMAVCIGLMLAFVGFNPVVGGIRYTFGITYLWDGIRMVPVFIGLFAVAAAIELAMEGVPVAGSGVRAYQTGRLLWSGILSPFKHLWLFMRCSALGTLIGIIPGVGGVVASFLAYGHSVQSAKDKSQFGKGDIRGVIGPESANNAVLGGALIPTLAFGIPGSEVTALLLAAFLIHGITPGPEMLETRMTFIWVLIWSLIISNLFGSALTIMAAPQMVKITRIRPVYLVPIIMAVSLIGTYAFDRNILDVVAAVVIGLLGYVMKLFKIPVAAAVIAYILGSIMERSFFQTLQMGRGSFATAFERPFTAGLAILIVITLLAPYYGSIKGYLARRRAGGATGGQE